MTDPKDEKKFDVFEAEQAIEVASIIFEESLREGRRLAMLAMRAHDVDSRDEFLEQADAMIKGAVDTFHDIVSLAKAMPPTMMSSKPDTCIATIKAANREHALLAKAFRGELPYKWCTLERRNEYEKEKGG